MSYPNLARSSCALPSQIFSLEGTLKVLHLMVGLPRSGKSTIARKLSKERGIPIVNPDSVRLALHGQAFIKEAEGFVWAITRNMINALFLAGHDEVLLDATNITQKSRDAWANGIWGKRVFHWVNTDFTVCLDRCTDPALAPVIIRMHETFEPLEEELSNENTELNVYTGHVTVQTGHTK